MRHDVVAPDLDRADGRRFSVESVRPAERARLVRLCARLSGDPEMAEDLTQETLIEAWRHGDRLRDPTGQAAWLAAIARNVCRRWLRRRGQGRERSHQPAPGGGHLSSLAVVEPTGGDDLEIELERAELAALLDRAMALLPPASRQVLVERCLLGTPQAEVAARLGLSEGAVAVRLHRGKLALRRVLVTDLRREAAEYGVPVGDAAAIAASTRAADPAGWRATRIWCSICGERRLLARVAPATGEFAVRCPRCSVTPDDHILQTVAPKPLRGITSYKVMLFRLMAHADSYYQAALTAGAAACSNCGGPARLHRRPSDAAPAAWRGERGLHLYCASCEAPTSWATLRALVIARPEGRRFWKRHPRIRSLPARAVAVAGRAALLSTFVSVDGAARLEVLSARDTYETLVVEERPGA